MLHHVFVYGSLLSGLQNHAVMIKSKGKFISFAKTSSKYFMTARGDFLYPYLTDTTMSLAHQQSHHIIGEIYQVDDIGLSNLDELEEYPVYYDRQLIDVISFNELLNTTIITTQNSMDDNYTATTIKSKSDNNDQSNTANSITNLSSTNIIKCHAYFLYNQKMKLQIQEKFNVDYFDVSNGDWRKFLKDKEESSSCNKPISSILSQSILPSSYATKLMTDVEKISEI